MITSTMGGDDTNSCEDMVHEFLEDSSPEGLLLGDVSISKECFRVMKVRTCLAPSSSMNDARASR